MAGEKVEVVKLSEAERKMLMNAMKAYISSLTRSVTKEGESEVGELYAKRLGEARNLEMKIITKELF